MSESKHNRRTQRTKRAIYTAFAGLLSEKELHKITVQELVDRADIGRATFYTHYLDIYDLNDKIEGETMTIMSPVSIIPRYDVSSECCMLFDSMTVKGGLTPEAFFTRMIPETRRISTISSAITVVRFSFFMRGCIISKDKNLIPSYHPFSHGKTHNRRILHADG